MEEKWKYWKEVMEPIYHLLEERNQEILERLKVEDNWRAKKDEYSAVGREDSYRIEGYAKASGQAKFTNDVFYPDMLYAKLIRCPYGHARIKSMDTSKAEALPGVKGIIRYDDPEAGYLGLGDEAFYEGHWAGAAVCAESEEICDEALRLIDVQWEELPFALHAEQALESDTKLHGGAAKDNVCDFGVINARGDIEQGFAEADEEIEFDWKNPICCHSVAETGCAVVAWEGDSVTGHGEHVTIHHTTQALRGSQFDSYMVGLPMSRATAAPCYLGGGFGHKYGDRGALVATSAIFSKKLGKPVKCGGSRSADQVECTDASYDKAHFRVGFKKDGLITAVHIDALVSDGQGGFPGTPRAGEGGTCNIGGGFNRGGIWGATKIPHIVNEVTAAYTSQPKQAWMRGTDYPEVGLNMVISMVADALGMDPAEVALKNAPEYEPGVGGIYSLDECIREAKERIGWDEKWHAPGAKELPNGRMHGIGFRWCEEYNGGTYPENQAEDAGAVEGFSIAVEALPDGSIRLLGSLSDVGQGSHSAFAALAAEELGAKLEDVLFLPNMSSSDMGFTPHPWGSSTGLASTGPAVREAARKVKQMLIKRGAYFLGVNPEDCDTRDSTVYVKEEPEKALPFVACCTWARPTIAGASPFVPFVDPANNYQVTMTEVEVDPETGEVELTNAVCVNDVGKAFRPLAVNGQQYGGYIFGIGPGLIEELVFDEATGVRLNPNLLDYKIPTLLDCPPIDCCIEEIGSGAGVYGSVGIGENVFSRVNFPIAIYNAIGKWIDLPITPDKVLKALGKI